MDNLHYLLEELTSGDDSRAETAAVHIPTFGEAAINALLDLYSSNDEDSRWWATRALSAFEEIDTSQHLISALEDTSPHVRECAALGLRTHLSESAVPALIELLNSPNKLLSRLSADALIAIGKPATAQLITIAESEENKIHTARTQAVRALALIANPDSIPTLFKAYQNGSALIQYWAEEGLNKMGVGMVFFNPGG